MLHANATIPTGMKAIKAHPHETNFAASTFKPNTCFMLTPFNSAIKSGVPEPFAGGTRITSTELKQA